MQSLGLCRWGRAQVVRGMCARPAALQRVRFLPTRLPEGQHVGSHNLRKFKIKKIKAEGTIASG